MKRSGVSRRATGASELSRSEAAESAAAIPIGVPRLRVAPTASDQPEVDAEREQRE